MRLFLKFFFTIDFQEILIEIISNVIVYNIHGILDSINNQRKLKNIVRKYFKFLCINNQKFNMQLF